MIVVVETIKAVEGKREELKEALLSIVPLSRKAPGCLQYDLLEPVDPSDEFLVLMRWEDLESHRSHERSDYIAAFEKKYSRLYDDVKVTEWKG